MYATVCPRNRKMVQFVVTRREADVSMMMNNIKIEIQSHQRVVPDAFCILEVYINWNLVVRYFGGVLAYLHENPLLLGPKPVSYQK